MAKPTNSHTTVNGSKSENAINGRQLEQIVVYVTALAQKQPLTANRLLYDYIIIQN